MPDTPELIPWERLPGESTPAFQAFAAYRDMGAERTSRAVAAQLGKSAALIHRWSSRWQWVDRAQAYDDQLDREAVEASRRFVREQAAKMTERHLRGALTLQRKAIERINALAASDLTPAVAAAYYKLAVDVERLAVGQVTSRDEIVSTGGVNPVDPALVERVANDPTSRRLALDLLAAVSGEDASDVGAPGVGSDEPSVEAG